MTAVRLESAYEQAIMTAVSRYPATPFNLNYADADGQPLALCLLDILLRSGWSQLSPVSQAPGFARHGLVVWAPKMSMNIAEAFAASLRDLSPVQVVERHDGGPVALTVGLATWKATRGSHPMD
ncbi:MAG: hypothetical protein M3R21_05320 [Candidatus Dormibacteraeota bacterium]|nr:hypothetical protein [Candidatus Dormibacteraeota bacterium]